MILDYNDPEIYQFNYAVSGSRDMHVPPLTPAEEIIRVTQTALIDPTWFGLIKV